jgi:hypothetical protein
MKTLALAAAIVVLAPVPVRTDSPRTLSIISPLDSKSDFLCMTNQDGKLVNLGNGDPGGCELTRTQIDASGDRDLDVWECLVDNPTPGVDQLTLSLQSGLPSGGYSLQGGVHYEGTGSGSQSWVVSSPPAPSTCGRSSPMVM